MTTGTCAGIEQGLLCDNSAGSRNITFTCLLESCFKSRFQFLQQQIFQGFSLLGERLRLDVTYLTCLLVSSHVCEMQAVKILFDLLCVLIICIYAVNFPADSVSSVSILGPYGSYRS